MLKHSVLFRLFPRKENFSLEIEENRVKEEWTAYIKDGGELAEPEKYITLK